ncbi:MAG: squalene--hopene cyclase [Deltaproteobacteria bacterium]|nr:squalene--hopene cyclase [Deltaproteobacteria bacterium]
MPPAVTSPLADERTVSSGHAADLLPLERVIAQATTVLRHQQVPEGYWWYTLEANETIGAELIFLEHCLDRRTPGRWARLARRMLDEQGPDGSWSLAYGETGDVSATLECYVALRLAGYEKAADALVRARSFIADHGGLNAARVFTQIHFACLGLVPWSTPPSMPIEILLLPSWAPFSIYAFSSWARACIIPLLIVMSQRPVWPLPIDHLVEEIPRGNGNGRAGRRDIWAEFFRWVDRIMKVTHPFTQRRPTRGVAARRAEEWIRSHLAKTEDIFPALAYGSLALAALGHAEEDPSIAKALTALDRFQHSYPTELPALPFSTETDAAYAASRVTAGESAIHQQCCISPVWDTPWAMCALRAAGVPADDPALLRAATWLLSQQITDCYGDWHKKNPDGKPGGWAFEFENHYFPDVDDTIQVLLAIHGTALPHHQVASATARALDWCLSMQNDDGGWAAFDKNNSLAILNKIPFADHGACLDPSSPDISGRMLQLLTRYGFTVRDRPIMRAISYLRQTQERDGSWFGRWGVNYIYGTWAVLTGLCDIGVPADAPEMVRAAEWLASIQQADGGFGESVESYPRETYVKGSSTASQTAWGLMGLIAAGHGEGPVAAKAARFLCASQGIDGTWNERACTGTGFPGHFYLRYHGYRHYFPLLALGKYRQILSEKNT